MSFGDLDAEHEPAVGAAFGGHRAGQGPGPLGQAGQPPAAMVGDLACAVVEDLEPDPAAVAGRGDRAAVDLGLGERVQAVGGRLLTTLSNGWFHLAVEIPDSNIEPGGFELAEAEL